MNSGLHNNDMNGRKSFTMTGVLYHTTPILCHKRFSPVIYRSDNDFKADTVHSKQDGTILVKTITRVFLL